MEGESTRQQKVAKQIQKDLAEIIRSKGMAAFDGALELGRLVAKQLRIVPELAFYLDGSLDYAEHIDELLKK